MNGPDDEILHLRLDPDGEEPATQIAQHVSEISNSDQSELESTWQHFDHVIDSIFETPPVPEAQVEVTFTYEGYRITVEQDGHAKFVEVED